MANEQQVVERLRRYAYATARNVLRRQGLERHEFRLDDIAQTLLLAGWQVWRDTEDVGLAKHRISTRAKNEAEKLDRELRQPRPLSSLRPVRTGEDEQVSPAELVVDRRGDQRPVRPAKAVRPRPCGSA